MKNKIPPIIATPAITPMTIPAIVPPDSPVSGPDTDPDDDVLVAAVPVAGCVEVDELVVVSDEDVVVALESTLNEFIAAEAFLLSI
jgi:hypothetical protein